MSHVSASPRLPEPDDDARAHSAHVAARIADDLAASGGWISFARYMELALYAPGLGYYAGGAAKFGGAGDFVTAPELTPLFGATLARVARVVLERVGGDVLVITRYAGDMGAPRGGVRTLFGLALRPTVSCPGQGAAWSEAT